MEVTRYDPASEGAETETQGAERPQEGAPVGGGTQGSSTPGHEQEPAAEPGGAAPPRAVLRVVRGVRELHLRLGSGVASQCAPPVQKAGGARQTSSLRFFCCEPFGARSGSVRTRSSRGFFTSKNRSCLAGTWFE